MEAAEITQNLWAFGHKQQNPLHRIEHFNQMQLYYSKGDLCYVNVIN